MVIVAVLIGGIDMRLWHIDLIKCLPRQQLLGQHRECCALRGRGWGRPHATVNYVFRYSPRMLYDYHIRVMAEMKRRGYDPDPCWLDARYRGKVLQYAPYTPVSGPLLKRYPEHDAEYLVQCLENLQHKGINLNKEIRLKETLS